MPLIILHCSSVLFGVCLLTMLNRCYMIKCLRLDATRLCYTIRCYTIRRYMMSIRMMLISRIAGLSLQQLDSIYYGDHKCMMAFTFLLNLSFDERPVIHALVENEVYSGKFSVYITVNFRKVAGIRRYLYTKTTNLKFCTRQDSPIYGTVHV